jgi:uncharacterized protein (DUF1778 family)
VGTDIANARTEQLELSDRDIQMLLEMTKNSPAPDEKLRKVMRRYKGAISEALAMMAAAEPELIERINRLFEGAVVDPDEFPGDGTWTKDEQSGEMFWIGSSYSAQVGVIDGQNGLWLRVNQTVPIFVFDRLSEGYDWPKIEGLDEFELGPVRVASVQLRELFRPFVINLSKRDFEFSLEQLENPPAPNEKLKEAARRHHSAIADSQVSDTKSITDIVDTE